MSRASVFAVAAMVLMLCALPAIASETSGRPLWQAAHGQPSPSPTPLPTDWSIVELPHIGINLWIPRDLQITETTEQGADFETAVTDGFASLLIRRADIAISVGDEVVGDEVVDEILTASHVAAALEDVVKDMSLDYGEVVIDNELAYPAASVQIEVDSADGQFTLVYLGKGLWLFVAFVGSSRTYEPWIEPVLMSIGRIDKELTQASPAPVVVPAATSTPTQSPTRVASMQTWYITSSSAVNVRSCRSTSCEAIGSVGPGRAIQVIDTEDDWHQILLSTGERGFVAAWLTGRTRPAVQPTARPQQSMPDLQQATLQPQSSQNCNGDLYSCTDFGSCAAVMRYWNACPGDPSSLDGDGNGRPCESLCGG